MKPANLAPVWLSMGVYPELTELCREHGYCLAVHGSCGRDLDLIAVPWVDTPATPDRLIQEITTKFAFRVVGESNAPKPHGRLCTTLIVSFGECFLDFSVMQPKGPHGV